MLKRVILAALAIIVIACGGLLALLLNTETARSMDRELLKGLPVAIWGLIQAPTTLAGHRVADSTRRYTEQLIPGAVGEPAVRVIIIDPPNVQPGRPGLLDLHGGGFMYGSPEQSATAYLDMLARLGITVVSVDYRLAPATRYPGSLHDNYAALKWFHDNAAAMGVDPGRIATLGVSAGGGHAAALGIHARNQGEVPIRFQVLLCPMLDDRTGSTIDPGPSYGQFLWTREDNRKGWAALLGVPPGGDDVPEDAVPARVADLTKLPPTYIAVGTLDLFAVEDIAFAERLKSAGVPTELQVFAGGFHSFEFIVPSAAISRRSMQALESYIVKGFGLQASAHR